MVSTSLLPRARKLSPGETLTLSSQDWARVPPGFAETSLSGLRRADTYREDRPTRPLVVRHPRERPTGVRGWLVGLASLVRRRTDDRVVVGRDRYHPRYHPLKHLAFDVLPEPLVTSAGRVGTALGRTG
jgi:hypothetical protein